MDADNERKVFELVVKAACRPNTPQYFLLTPKVGRVDLSSIMSCSVLISPFYHTLCVVAATPGPPVHGENGCTYRAQRALHGRAQQVESRQLPHHTKRIL